MTPGQVSLGILFNNNVPPDPSNNTYTCLNNLIAIQNIKGGGYQWKITPSFYTTNSSTYLGNFALIAGNASSSENATVYPYYGTDISNGVFNFQGWVISIEGDSGFVYCYYLTSDSNGNSVLTPVIFSSLVYVTLSAESNTIFLESFVINTDFDSYTVTPNSTSEWTIKNNNTNNSGTYTQTNSISNISANNFFSQNNFFTVVTPQSEINNFALIASLTGIFHACILLYDGTGNPTPPSIENQNKSMIVYINSVIMYSLLLGI